MLVAIKETVALRGTIRDLTLFCCADSKTRLPSPPSFQTASLEEPVISAFTWLWSIFNIKPLTSCYNLSPAWPKLGGWEEIDPEGETDKLDISDGKEIWAGLGVESPQAPRSLPVYHML